MLTKKEDKIFATVLADGKIHIECNEGDAGATKREYETSTGATGTKWEHIYDDVSGIISKVDFYEGEYGKSLQLTITDGDEPEVVLSLSTASNYGEDMMKKLPNVDLEQQVKIVPFSFTDDNGKNKKGITIYQNGEKISNYFYDTVEKTNLHGYPEVPKPKGKKEKLSTDEWKIYFMECRVFLIDKINELFKLEDELESI